ncbi:MAG TPA: sugar transferase, partial [Candidatus Margulisiibacteriota bacterium]|nr:sugar transferase [Candidatus Margulisiibacteriota bacterium]
MGIIRGKTRIMGLSKISIILMLISIGLFLEPAYKKMLPFSDELGKPETEAQLYIPYQAASGSAVALQQDYLAGSPGAATIFFFFASLVGLFVDFMSRRFRELKRGMDLFLAALALFVTMPFLFLAALLIKLTSKGPVIYRQHRVGKGGKIFRIYKLRTMRADAEKATGAVWAKANDPRITPLGRILRKSHFDEVPQLLNVIKGEMSIVGPRPERPEMVRDFKEVIWDYEKRLQMHPGITGMAQVYHKYDETIVDVRKKVKYDLLYARKLRW